MSNLENLSIKDLKKLVKEEYNENKKLRHDKEKEKLILILYLYKYIRSFKNKIKN